MELTTRVGIYNFKGEIVQVQLLQLLQWHILSLAGGNDGGVFVLFSMEQHDFADVVEEADGKSVVSAREVPPTSRPHELVSGQCTRHAVSPEALH